MAETLRIAILGLGPKTASLLNAGMPVGTIAETLNVEDQDKLEDELTPLSERDVRDYQKFMQSLEVATLDRLHIQGVDDQRLAVKVKDRLMKTLSIMERVDEAVKETEIDMATAREKWRGMVDQGVMPRSYFPKQQMDLLISAAAEGRQIVKEFHQDRGIQSFIKNATVNVNTGGMPMRDVVLILREMAPTLNIPLDRMLGAFSDAQDVVARKAKTIDV